MFVHSSIYLLARYSAKMDQAEPHTKSNKKRKKANLTSWLIIRTMRNEDTLQNQKRRDL